MATAGQLFQSNKQEVISQLVAGGMALIAQRIEACLYQGRRCGLTLACPTCRWSRALSLRDALIPSIQANLSDGMRLATITITIPDPPRESLGQAFQRMRKSVRAFTSKIAGVTGTAFSFESVPSPDADDLEHLHAHGYIALDPLVNRGRQYVSDLALHELWGSEQSGGAVYVTDLSKDNRLVIPDDFPIHARMDQAAARHARFCGYMVKSSPLALNDQLKAELSVGFVPRIQQLHRLRRFHADGSLTIHPHTVRPNQESAA